MRITIEYRDGTSRTFEGGDAELIADQMEAVGDKKAVLVTVGGTFGPGEGIEVFATKILRILASSLEPPVPDAPTATAAAATAAKNKPASKAQPLKTPPPPHAPHTPPHAAHTPPHTPHSPPHTPPHTPPKSSGGIT